MTLFGSNLPRIILSIVFTPPDNKPHPREDYPFDPRVMCVDLVPGHLYIMSHTVAEGIPVGAVLMVDHAETSRWSAANGRSDAWRVNLYEDGLLSVESALMAMDAKKYTFVQQCRDQVIAYRTNIMHDVAETRIMLDTFWDNGLSLHAGTGGLEAFKRAAHGLLNVNVLPFTFLCRAAGEELAAAIEIIEQHGKPVDGLYMKIGNARKLLKLPQLIVKLGVLTRLASQARYEDGILPKDRARMAFHQLTDLSGDFKDLRHAVDRSGVNDKLDTYDAGCHDVMAAAHMMDPLRDDQHPDDAKEAHRRLTLAIRRLALMA